MKNNTVRKLHRWLGVIFSLSLLMSAGSGIIHQVMSRTQAPPPPARPAGEGLAVEKIQISVAEAVKKLPQPELKTKAISIRVIEGQPWYQFMRTEGDKPRVDYVNAETGTYDVTRDEIYAQQIASDFLNGMPVKKTDYLTAFDGEYLAIFRILPAYRFDAGDSKETRVYVSTMTGSVTRHTDKQKQWEANIFTNFHKLGFIRDKNIRDAVLIGTTSGIFFLACLGLVIFFKKSA